LETKYYCNPKYKKDVGVEKRIDNAIGKEDAVNKELDTRKTNSRFFKNKCEKMQLKRNLKKLANGIRDFSKAIYWILLIIFLIFYVIFTPFPEGSE
jgi:hypothetical protein